MVKAHVPFDEENTEQPEPKDESPAPATDNIPIVKNDKEIDALVADMPKVVPDAIEAAQNKENQTQAVQEAAKDNKGRAFDPSIHKADAAGNPEMTSTGRFKRKLRMPGDNHHKTASLNLPPDTAPDMKIKIAAGKLADVFIITGISFFGDEWKPEISKDFNERQMLIDANERFMIEHGYVEPPAWIDLALAYGLYTGKRIIQRKPEGRIEKLWQWGKMKATNFWLWVTGQKVKVVSTEGK